MNLQNPFVRWAMWMAGIKQETANQVQSAIPTIQALVRLSQKASPTVKKIEAWWAKAGPLIDQGVPLINEAQPFVKQAMPLIEKAWDEWQEIAPAFNALLESLHQQQLAGVKRGVATDSIVATLSAKYGFKKVDKPS